MKHVFQSEQDWWVAKDLEEAASLFEAHYEQTLEEMTDELRQLPDEGLLSIICDQDGDPSDEGEDVTKTHAEWAAERESGLLCTTEF